MSNAQPETQGTGIVHLGPGAFHRAHQAVYSQDAMAASGGDWRSLGVSLRSTDVADALIAQEGRYTLVTRTASDTEYRVVRSISGAVAAVRDLTSVKDALMRPSTRIVSLTVTEKAYRTSDNPGPTDVIRLLCEALGHRKAAKLAPFTLLSCDNLPNNGDVLRRAVIEHAQGHDPALADWIAETACFPATMVDRITPASTPALLAEVAAETGWADQIPVETEPFSQWVIEDNFNQGRPDWEAAGALLVSDVAPYEHMKLRMLNGAHSMLAYAGHLAGKIYVRDVMADPGLAALVARQMTAAAATLTTSAGLDCYSYQSDLLARFRNPHMAHETYQIAMDGSQKMPQRIFAPALDAAHAGQDISAFAFATACWARYLGGETDAGTRFALRDPREAELGALPSNPQDRIDALFSLPDLLPPALAADEAFRTACTNKLSALSEHGVDAVIKEELHG